LPPIWLFLKETRPDPLTPVPFPAIVDEPIWTIEAPRRLNTNADIIHDARSFDGEVKVLP